MPNREISSTTSQPVNDPLRTCRYRKDWLVHPPMMRAAMCVKAQHKTISSRSCNCLINDRAREDFPVPACPRINKLSPLEIISDADTSTRRFGSSVIIFQSNLSLDGGSHTLTGSNWCGGCSGGSTNSTWKGHCSRFGRVSGAPRSSKVILESFFEFSYLESTLSQFYIR